MFNRQRRHTSYHLPLMLAVVVMGAAAILNNGDQKPDGGQPLSTESDPVSALLTAAATQAPQAVAVSDDIVTESIALRYSDSLYAVLQREGFNDAPARNIVNTLRSAGLNPRRLEGARQITYAYDYNGADGRRRPHKVALKMSNGRQIALRLFADGAYRIAPSDSSGFILTFKSEGVLKGDFIATFQRYGVPRQALNEALAALSYEVDFQREIHDGDRFKIMYEIVRDPLSHEMTDSRLLMLHMTLGAPQRTIALYRFDESKLLPPFYHADGESVARALLRTPLNAGRISSGFGERRHPVLGYNRFHHGVDFAAPPGTPVFAAGDGVVTAMTTSKQAGNYIVLTHNSVYDTLYAHLQGFASGLLQGARVKQGQIIGYVGDTGMSTGPHLHYETRRDGESLNPMALSLPGAVRLRAKPYERLRDTVRYYEQLYHDLPHWQLAERSYQLAGEPVHGDIAAHAAHIGAATP